MFPKDNLIENCYTKYEELNIFKNMLFIFLERREGEKGRET